MRYEGAERLDNGAIRLHFVNSAGDDTWINIDSLDAWQLSNNVDELLDDGPNHADFIERVSGDDEIE
jgi:hypothetical protein